MDFYNEWTTNYNSLLNTLFQHFLIISEKNGINIINNGETFNHFCYMIYTNSKNDELKNEELFSYVI
jgi:hypothetical protein